MPYASRRDPDDLEGLAAALEALVGTEYEEQVFVWVDGALEGRSLDVVHSADDIEGEPLMPTAVAEDRAHEAEVEVELELDDEDDWEDDVVDDDPEADDEWAEPEGRYLVWVGYAPGPPFAERAVPIPDGTLLVDDDGTGATVALPPLPVGSVVEVLGAWARVVLGGAAIGGIWWATTFDDDDGSADGDHG